MVATSPAYAPRSNGCENPEPRPADAQLPNVNDRAGGTEMPVDDHDEFEA